MIILVEGLDRTGKSTLAQALATDLNLTYLRFGVPPEGDLLCHFRDEIEERRKLGRGVVVDRMHLSNYAYNGELGGPVLTAAEWSVMDAYVARRRGYLLLMTDTPFNIETRLRQEGDSEASGLTREDIGRIARRFNVAFNASSIPNKGTYCLPHLIVPATGDRTAYYERIIEQLKSRKGGSILE